MPLSSNPVVATRPANFEGPQPQVRWSQLTDAPLVGLALAREAGLVLAWDDAHNIYLIDFAGKRLHRTRTPVPLGTVVISDDGSQIVATSKDGEIYWLSKNLEPRLQQGAHKHLIGLAISPQGEFLAAGLNDSHTFIYDCHGRRITNLMTHRPLRHMTFLMGQPYLMGAAEYGLAGCYELDGEPRWQDALWSSAGHLTASGEGYAILISCYSHGLQRYGLDGTNEGSYHLGGGVARASIDYDGKLFAAATLEGEILLVNTAGHVLWRQMLSKPAKEIALDAAGRTLIYGQESGEITALDLFSAGPGPDAAQAQPAELGADRASPAVAASVSGASESAVEADTTESGKQLREPTWKIAAFDSESQAETAVLGLLEHPVRVVAFSNRKRIEVYDKQGEWIHTGEVMSGVGRYLDADAGLVVAATDREVALVDVAANSSFRFPDRLTQISHIRLDSEAGEIVIVEERDRLSRFDLSGRRRWVKTIDSPVEGLAIGADRSCAVTTEDGRLIVFDGDKRIVSEFRTVPRETLALVRLGPRWITLAGKSQRIRSHRLDGTTDWEVHTPTEAWRLVRLASRVVARDAAGRSYVVDARGQMILDSTELPPEAVLFLNLGGEPLAVFWRAGNLMVTDLVGRVNWRHLSPETLGPVTAGAAGVACALGRELVFFAG